MTVWDKDALEAPHTLRELAQDGEPAPDSTTEPENATCPSAGGFGGLARVEPLVWERHPAGWIAAPPTGQAYIIDVRIKGCVMFLKGMNPSRQFDDLDVAKAAAQADYEARILSALQSIITPQAVLTAIAAEKATWPHAGALHDGARKACDNIATRIKQLMGDA